MQSTFPTAPADRERITAIIAEFRSAMNALRCIGSERLVRLGISMTQLHVITLLERHGQVPMSRLADLLDVSVSNATGLIDRMEERGIVERVGLPGDRRVVIVRVTERGREILAELEVLRDDLLRRIVGHLDEPQLERVAIALNDLREAIDATVASEPDMTDGVHTHGQQPGG